MMSAKKQKPKSLVLRLSTKIAPNDLKFKIDKVKSEINKKGVDKLFVDIECNMGHLDQANALLLSVKKILEGTMIHTAKSEVRKRDEDSEETVTVDQEEIIDALEYPEEDKKPQVKDKPKEFKKDAGLVTLRQEFLNPAKLTEQSKVPKAAKAKTENVVPEAKVALTDEEIVKFIEKEFAKLAGRGDDFVIQTSESVVTEEQEKLENMFKSEERADFNPVIAGDEPRLHLKDSFMKRIFGKIERGFAREKQGFVTKKETNKKLKKMETKDTRLLNADFMKGVTTGMTEEYGIFLDKGLKRRVDGRPRNDPETRSRIAAQMELLKRL